ncbi:MAG: glycosyltransferase family 2 protein [Candidatus Blackburnbacteria bacterium]|nr:glycosyltransferase family 2 protein [Candidatus Blackburnbacteria bacterium]
MQEIDLSVIVLNFNTKRITVDCLTSIFKYTKGISYEVIVVDNASTDGSGRMLRNFQFLISNFQLIRNRKNLGFAAGNNVGIKKARGRYVLLLNSDTYLSGNSLKEMVEFMDEHPDVGVSSCRLANPDGTTQATGGFFPTLPRVFAWMFFLDDIPLISSLLKPVHPYSKSGFYDKDHEQDWITGAFFMIRDKVIDQIGLLDEDYFMYMEDVDYCYRVRQKSWRVFYTTRTKITHIGGASGGSENTIISELKNLKLFYKKHYPHWQGAILSVLMKVGVFLRAVFFGVLLGRRNHLKIYAKAFAIL